MRFDEPKLTDLIGAPADGDMERACERANLLMEERISGQRHKEYEEHVISKTPAQWADWRAAHENYVDHFVRGGNGKEPSTFCLGESTLYRPQPNQFVLRLEDLNELLVQEGSLDERRRDPVQAAQVAQSINTLITESRTKRTNAEEKSVSSFKALGKLGLKDPLSPDTARLKSLTEALNIIRSDRRPSFIALDAEFTSLDQENDWLVQFCERCGLSRHFAGYPKVLALLRYQVEAVTSVAGGRPVFAAPTVLDYSFSPGFFPAPAGVSLGHAVALSPQADCLHLAAELLHARIDYLPEHWVRVGVLNRPALDGGILHDLRVTHLECLRLRTGKHNYGGLPA